MNQVAKNLRALREAASLSENELSRITGVPQPTIHRIEGGSVADPRDGTLRPLAEHFRVSVEALRTSSTSDLLDRIQGINEALATYRSPQKSQSETVPADDGAQSQPVQLELWKIAFQLVADVLNDANRELPPPKQAEVTFLAYELLSDGMPTAKVLRFVRAAAA